MRNHHHLLARAFWLILLFLVGCGPVTPIPPPNIQIPTQRPTEVIPTIPPTSTPTSTSTARPTRTSTPTYAPMPTPRPTPTPEPLETNWTLGYTATEIDDPQDPLNNSHWEIRSKQFNSRQPMKLIDEVTSTWDPKWSPDGKWLAFISEEEYPGTNPDSLMIQNLTTGDKTKIKNVSKFDWSIDSQKIAYCQDNPYYFVKSPPPVHCYLSKVDNPDQTRITLISKNWDHVLDLQWSPVGDQILVFPVPIEGPTEIYLINLDGRVKKVPTKKEPWVHAAWHPDGNRIAYDVYQKGYELSDELREIDLQTMEDRELTHTGEIVSDPAWSPDGKYLAYVSWPPNKFETASNVHILNTETGETKVISNGNLDVGLPTWSPDGKYLAFVQSIGVDSRTKGSALKVYDLATDHLTTLLENGVYGYILPSWKPQP